MIDPRWWRLDQERENLRTFGALWYVDVDCSGCVNEDCERLLEGITVPALGGRALRRELNKHGWVYLRRAGMVSCLLARDLPRKLVRVSPCRSLRAGVSGSELLPSGETLDELSEAVWDDPNAPPVLVLAVARYRMLGDASRLRALVDDALALDAADAA